MGRKALLNWFAMGSRNLLRGVLPVNKVTERFIHAHRQELSTIADKNTDEGERKKAILKRGGAGFLGGTIIRHLFKWETQKKKRVPPLRIRLPPTQKVPPLRIRLPPKKKSPKQKSPTGKLIVKFPFGKKKKSPKKSMMVRIPLEEVRKSMMVRIPLEKVRKSMMVRIPLEKLRNVTPVKKTKMLADLKMGLAQKKMERAMQGPIGSSRTSDTTLPSFS
jgi:hypothetical protein